MEGQIGTEGKYEIKFENGKVVLSLGYAGADTEAGAYVKQNAAPVLIKALDELKVIIPGHFDDMLIDAAKEQLSKLLA